MTDGLGRLESIFGEMGSVLVAFSGGVDSAVVLAVAHRVLGDRAVAMTARSETFPVEEEAVAEQVGRTLGVRHLWVDSHELEREAYRANTGDRCYHCKSELFELAEVMRGEQGLKWVSDGTLLDDLGGHRPGLVAASENQVRHPLVEAGLDKMAVRAIAKDIGLTVWDKPSFACLGSRFPTGTTVDIQRIKQVGTAESGLRALGFRQMRVRWHDAGNGDSLARIEVPPRDIGGVVDLLRREAIEKVCREAGFRWVTVDLRGYRPPERSPQNSE